MKLNNLKNFKLLRQAKLPELHSDFFELEHVPTEARYIHLKSKNTENVFCVAFKTIPKDSTGVAHILEHSVLAGSRKYPVHDSFFSMVKRSLNTFMNAFTSVDWTAYPFATQNKKDFYNLLSVYLDAVFFPLISENTFRQEGWRLDFDGKNLVYKGVVYNEMKGVLSSPDRVMENSLKSALFPTTTYQYNSGGDPAEISKLTYANFKEFHKKHYHPSNAYFFSYGNFKPEKHLAFLENNYLKKFSKIDPKTEVKLEPDWIKEKKLIYSYPIGKSKKIKQKYQVALAWRLASAEQEFELLSLDILESILLSGSAAPLRKALIESNLGSGLSDGAGLEVEFRSAIFSVGLKEVLEQDALKIKKIILNTLEDLVKNGIEENLIEAALQKLEFHHKEITNSPYPYGLQLNLSLLNSWIHGGEALKVLRFSEDIELLKAKIRSGKFLESQIKKYFLANKNRALIILKPDQNLQADFNQKTKAELLKIQKNLNQESIEKIKENNLALKQKQEKKEDTSCLPGLEIKDIYPEIKIISAYQDNKAKNKIYYNAPTHDIFYLREAFLIKGLNKGLLALVPFFCYLMPRIGTKSKDYLALAKELNLFVGGLKFSAHIYTYCNKNNSFFSAIFLDAKALVRNKEKAFGLVRELASDFDFSNLAILKNFLLEYLSKLESKIIEQGHLNAMLLAARKFSLREELAENWEGISQLQFIKKLVSDLGRDRRSAILTKLSQALVQIGQAVFQEENKISALIGDFDQPDLFKNKKQFKEVRFADLRTVQNNLLKIKDQEFKIQEGWGASTNVSFVVCAFLAPDISHNDAPLLFVISKILRFGFLHRELREKRGAYGTFARYDFEDGIFYLVSYRDPNIVSTLEIYNQAFEFAQNGKFSEEDIKEAILQCISDLDRPDSPSQEAKIAFSEALAGLTPESKQAFRQAILEASPEKVVKVAKKYLNKSIKDCSVAVISSKEKIKAENKKLKVKLKIFEI